MEQPQSKLRRRILGGVGALIVVSLVAAVGSLFQISAVHRAVDGLYETIVPLHSLTLRIKSDGENLSKELERRLGFSHWNDPAFKPTLPPRWLYDTFESASSELKNRIDRSMLDAVLDATWKDYIYELTDEFNALKNQSDQLYHALLSQDRDQAIKIYPRWISTLEQWNLHLQRGMPRSKTLLHDAFEKTSNRIEALREGLQGILIVVVGLSLFLLWFGERALRPLHEMRMLVRKIREKSLNRDDKSLLSATILNRDNEVSELAREIQRMATQLLEHEETVRSQHTRLEDQNRQLKEMLALNSEIQKALTQAENLAMVGRMSAQVAHEVRNPLHSIGLEAEMVLEMLATQSSSKPELKSSLFSILDAVKRLETITDNYLQFSKISSGTVTNVSITSLLEEVIGTYMQDCKRLEIEVDWKVEGERDPMIQGDRALLLQSLSNLMKNAIQACEMSEYPRKILWRIGQDSLQKVWISIEDSGQGVPESIQSRIFTPFVTSKAKGTGLGLSLVQRAVQDHGGQIRCDRGETLTGARFILTLQREFNGKNITR